MALHNELGAWGEQVAREFLLTQGYAIGYQNFKIGKVEIDFIARKGDRICFVEVKTRKADTYDDPLDAVDQKKRVRMTRAADKFIRQFNIPLDPQFDIITIVGDPADYRIDYYPDAFFPILNNGF